VSLPGDVSSQYVTALMLIGPYLSGGLRLELTTPLVSLPYVELTAAVMGAFGVGDVVIGERSVEVPPGRYRATRYSVEPDASSASYPMATAAVVGGRVRVAGLRRSSTQADVAFAGVLEAMGCTVGDDPAGLTVERDASRPLRGVDVDLRDCSDLVPTVAAVAVTAATSTTISGVGFIRAKESDRLGDLAVELAKTGARIAADDDGLRIDPVDSLHGAVLATHHDHRLAMAFGVLGTVVDGIRITDPEVVSKSWPGYWFARDSMLGVP
jgi:3-phosphoshikimate 1-carboxyvinyltransferase